MSPHKAGCALGLKWMSEEGRILRQVMMELRRGPKMKSQYTWIPAQNECAGAIPLLFILCFISCKMGGIELFIFNGEFRRDQMQLLS